MRIRVCVPCLFALLLSPVSLLAQSTSATLVGSVQDKLGAAIGDVAVEVKNLDENTTRATLSNAQSQYQLSNLKPGRYEVAAQKTGVRRRQNSRGHP